MKLNKNTNYIVSGLERSGTSLMMQLLEAGGIPVAYDNSRKADENNPKGYYELANGKIITKLREKSFPLKKYCGKFIKITSWGLQYLPDGKYEIIYMIRNTDEIVESTIKMSKKESYDKEKLHECLIKFDNSTMDWLKKKESYDFKYTIIFYNALVHETASELQLNAIKVRFPEFDVGKAKKVIDKKLYRNRIYELKEMGEIQ